MKTSGMDSTRKREVEGQTVARLKGNKDGAGRAGDSIALPPVPTAQYLSDMLPELIRVADRAGLELVVYLLQMANEAAAEEAANAKQTPGRSRASPTNRVT